MTIKSKIMHGVNNSLTRGRKRPFTLQDLDDFATTGDGLFNFVEYHSVRARVSELVKAGDLMHVGESQYFVPEGN